MKKWLQAWRSFPPAHKKRLGQAFAAYAVLCALALGGVALKAPKTLEAWKARVPSATAELKSTDAAYSSVTQETATTAPGPAPGTPQQPAAASADDGKNYVTIVVSGLGLSAQESARAVSDLPAEMMLAFSPYAQNVSDWVKKSAAAGHETLMMLPMETANYPQEDPGPRTLSSRFSDAENESNLEWILHAGQGSVGVVNFMGSRFMTDKKHLAALFAVLRKKDALFIETPGIERSAAPDAAARTGLPYAAADAAIDDDATEADIRAQLAALEKIAIDKGYAVGLARPYPLTLTVLRSWAGEIGSRGIVLAPLDTVLKNKPARRYDPAAQ